MTEKTYIQNDLIDYLEFDWEDYTLNTNHYRRKNTIEEVLPGEATVLGKRAGGYQGKVAVIVYLDNYIWLFTDYYGSCSGCDRFLANPKGWTEDMLRKAYCFETKEDLRQYIENSDDIKWSGSEGRQLKQWIIDTLDSKEWRDLFE